MRDGRTDERTREDRATQPLDNGRLSFAKRKKEKKTNISTFSATPTYLKLTFVSFSFLFFYEPFPYNIHSTTHACAGLHLFFPLGVPWRGGGGSLQRKVWARLSLRT